MSELRSHIKHVATKLLWLGISLSCSVSVVAEIKRTAEGLPDLSGTYNGATLTPLTRPPEFGNNLYLSKAQTEKLAAETEQLSTSPRRSYGWASR